MKRVLLLMLAFRLMVAACGGTEDEPTGGATTTEGATTTVGASTSAPPPAGGHPLVMRIIDFDTGMVEIANTGSEAYDLTGHWLCNRPRYVAVPGSTLEAGSSMMVSLDGLRIVPSDGRARALHGAQLQFGKRDRPLCGVGGPVATDAVVPP